jgi:hypothetical protein
MPFGLQPDNRFILRGFVVFEMVGLIAQNGPNMPLRSLGHWIYSVCQSRAVCTCHRADRGGSPRFMAANNNSRGGILGTEDSIFAG